MMPFTPACCAWTASANASAQFHALTDVSLELRAGEVHCLLGENGAGKSTLCNVMFGVHQPDAGTMWLDGAPYRPQSPRDALTHGIAMVHQHFSLVEDVSVLDNLLLGQARGWLDRKREAQRVRELVAELGLALDPDARVADLSVGEKQRVEIVKCLIREPRLLVLDEPTAVLLPAEIDALLDTCAKVVARGCAVVLVTHKLAEIRRIANRATVLQSGRVVARSSTPSADVDALVRAMIQRPANAEDAQVAENTQAAASHTATQSPSPYGRPLADEALQIDGLTVRDADGVTRLQDCTLVVNRGEIVGIAGVEGNGQSELGAVLAGMQKASAGRFFVQGKECTHAAPQTLTKAGVGVVPEDRHAVGCVPDMSVTDNLFLNRLDDYARARLHAAPRDAARRSRADAALRRACRQSRCRVSRPVRRQSAESGARARTHARRPRRSGRRATDAWTRRRRGRRRVRPHSRGARRQASACC